MPAEEVFRGIERLVNIKNILHRINAHLRFTVLIVNVKDSGENINARLHDFLEHILLRYANIETSSKKVI